MKKIYTLLAAGILSANFSYSQGLNWAKQLGGTNDDLGNAITSDPNGNVFSTGSYKGTADFDPGAGTFNLVANGRDAYVSKLNGSGNFVWAARIGGPTVGDLATGNGIAVDVSGNVYTTGYFMGTVDFDPGAGTFNMVSNAGLYDIYISKLDASGNFVWAKQIGSAGQDAGNGITLDPLGNIYVTGYFTNTADFDPNAGTFNLTSAGGYDAFVLKLDLAGNLVWADKLGGTGNDSGYGVTRSNSANTVYSTGYFNGTADLDPGAGTFNVVSAGSNDIFISSLTSAGAFNWGVAIGGSSFDQGWSITSDGLGNVYTTGIFSQVTDFDPGAGTYTLNGGNGNSFISKLNSSGNFVWARGFTGPFSAGFGIAIDNNSNVYTGGYFNGITDFNAQATSYTVASLGSDDIYIHKTDPSGNLIWMKQMAGNGADRCYAINVDATGNNILATGMWTITADFDPGPSSYTMTVAGTFGYNDAWIAKLSCTSNPSVGITSSSTSICLGQSATLTATGASSFVWNNGSTSPIIVVSPTTSTNYSVVGTNSVGCGNTAAQSLTVNPVPSLSVATSNSIICGPPNQQSATLTANGASSYTWITVGTGSAVVVSPSVTTTYTLVGSSGAGCQASIMITQSVTTCSSINFIEEQASLIGLYPNPNNGSFIVHALSDLEAVLVNEVGQVIRKISLNSSNGREVAIDDLDSGIYFIRNERTGGIGASKIVVIR